MVLLLAERGFITLVVEYIDGTKIESKANKYTFVWRKAVEKNRAKLQEYFGKNNRNRSPKKYPTLSG